MISRLAAVLGAAVVLAACGAQAAPSPRTAPAAAPTAAATPDCKDGRPAVASIDPAGTSLNASELTDSDTMDRILSKHRLTVGTSADVLLWGASDPESGDLQGFDIDVLKRVAAEIGVPITYKVITYAQRLPSLKTGDVDLVAHTMTINCPRWEGPAAGTNDASAPNAINFSSEYYLAGQRVLVREDSTARSISDLKNATVCVPAGSTNVAAAQKKGVTHLVQQAEVGDCLVLFQEGEVDAITGDDTVLAGFADQDPHARIVGDPFTQEPYGLGINAGDPQFTKYVNAVLQKMRDDGSLADLTQKWMGKALDGKVPAVPTAKYGREVGKLGRTS